MNILRAGQDGEEWVAWLGCLGAWKFWIAEALDPPADWVRRMSFLAISRGRCWGDIWGEKTLEAEGRGGEAERAAWRVAAVSPTGRRGATVPYLEEALPG